MATKKIYMDNKLISQNTSSYNDLYALPSINGVTLQGEVTSDELGIYSKQQVDELIAASKSIKVVPALPSTPLPNTQYYVGPTAGGGYHIYIYDRDLNRIDLGITNDMDLSAYQYKQPFVLRPDGSKQWDIGHNDNAEDGLTLTNHSVAGAINELDTKMQQKQDATSTQLQTANKTILGAVNELKEQVDGLGSGLRVFRPQWKSTGSGVKGWVHIATVKVKEDVEPTDSAVSATFVIAPDWADEWSGQAAQAAQFYSPVQLIFNVQYSKTNGFLCATKRPLQAIVQHKDTSCLRFNENNGPYMFVTWDDKQCQLWRYDQVDGWDGANLKFKLLVMDQDIGKGLTMNWVSEAMRTTDPKLNLGIQYNWKQLGYNTLSFS